MDNWKEEFYKKFTAPDPDTNGIFLQYTNPPEALEDFIASQLSDQKQRMMEILEGMRKVKSDDEMAKLSKNHAIKFGAITGYNQAIKDCIDLLENL